MDQITWQALEFKKYEKSGGWFAALWIVVAGLVVVAILTGSLMMAVLVVLAGLVVSLYAAKDPRKFRFSLSEKTLTVGEKSHPLEDFSSFWIFETEDDNILSLNPKKTLQTRIRVTMPKEHASNARLLLRAAMEESEQEESLVDVLADWLRF